jgi:hypothetical protein
MFSGDTSILNILPKTYKEADQDGSLQAFFNAVDLSWSAFWEQASNFDSSVLTPRADMQDNWLNHRGNPFHFMGTTEGRAKLIQVLQAIYSLRGSQSGMIATIKFLLGLDVTLIYDYEEAWELGMELLGEGTILLDERRPFVKLYAPQNLTNEQKSNIMTIVEFMKPQWLRVVYDGWNTPLILITPFYANPEYEFEAYVQDPVDGLHYSWSFTDCVQTNTTELDSMNSRVRVRFVETSGGPATMSVIYMSYGETYGNFLPTIFNVPENVTSIEFHDTWNSVTIDPVSYSGHGPVFNPLTNLTWVPGNTRASAALSWIPVYDGFTSVHPAGEHHITAVMRDSSNAIVGSLEQTYILENEGDFTIRVWPSYISTVELLRGSNFDFPYHWPEYDSHSSELIPQDGLSTTVDPVTAGVPLTPNSDNYILPIVISSASTDSDITTSINGFWHYPVFGGVGMAGYSWIFTNTDSEFGLHNGLSASVSSNGVTHTIDVPVTVISGIKMQAWAKIDQMDPENPGNNMPYYLIALAVLTSSDLSGDAIISVDQAPVNDNDANEYWPLVVVSSEVEPEVELGDLNGWDWSNTRSQIIVIKATRPSTASPTCGGDLVLTVSTNTSEYGPVSLTNFITIPTGEWQWS